jgi:hypothetical protein
VLHIECTSELRVLAAHSYRRARTIPILSTDILLVASSFERPALAAQYYANLSQNNFVVNAGGGWTLEQVSAQIDQHHPVMVNFGGCPDARPMGYSVVIHGITLSCSSCGHATCCGSQYHYYRKFDTVGELQAAPKSSVNREWRVRAIGIPFSQSSRRLRFVATAIAKLCKCVFAWPM